MLIDCDSCEVRGLACGDCVVGVLLRAGDDRDAAGGRAPRRDGLVDLPDPARRSRVVAMVPVGRADDGTDDTRWDADRWDADRWDADRWDEPISLSVSDPVELDDDQRRAIDVLAGAGLVPPLRLTRRRAG